MALTTMKELLVTAQKEKYAVGAFEFWSLDSAQAIIHAAETENVPVILQAGKIECDFCDGVKYLAQIAQIAAADGRFASGPRHRLRFYLRGYQCWVHFRNDRRLYASL